MVNRHMKRCSTLLIVREIQITTTKRFHLIPVRMSINNNKKTQITNISAAAKSLQSCPTLRHHRRQPARLPRPWDSPGKNIGMGFHFLLQCMNVKSQSEVAQSCPTLSNPVDCSPPGSSVHGIFQARVLEWVPLPSLKYW